MKMDRRRCRQTMLVPLLMMLLGFTLYFFAVLLVRLRAEEILRPRVAAPTGSRGDRHGFLPWAGMPPSSGRVPFAPPRSSSTSSSPRRAASRRPQEARRLIQEEET